MYKVSAHYLLHFTFLPSIIVYVQQSMIHDRERERTRRLIFISIDPHCCVFQAEGKRKPVLIWSCWWWGVSLPFKSHITCSLFVPSTVTFTKSQIYAHIYTQVNLKTWGSISSHKSKADVIIFAYWKAIIVFNDI